ncbi:MAG TPA: lysophospholipid acyltransferase family protein [Desulfuromonadales bacterium]|nr:lysophospholipid acyltransferase family protein [Desulfuromonadales bacterium]
MKRIVWALQTVLFYLITRSVSLIPQRFGSGAGRRIGLILFRLLASRRRIAIDNISRVLPFMKNHPLWPGTFETAEEVARETFMNLGRSIVEVCRLYHGMGDTLIDSIEVRGREHLEQARQKHKGLILVSGHCGNWELMSLSIKRLFNENMWAVARHQNNPYLHSVVEKFRMVYGNRVIYNKLALRQILSVLKSGEIVGMLTDQAVFQDNGVLVDVLGRKAWANKAPVTIAQKTGAPLIPAFIHRENGRHVITIYPAYELCGDVSNDGIAKDIQALSRYLDDFVCAHPTEWYWVHRRWKRTEGIS